MLKMNFQRFLAAFLIVCTLFTQGNVTAYGFIDATTTDTGVVLYKNDVLVGEYATINKAFDKMTDVSGDYKVVLKDDQTLSGYANWPTVNSIKIVPYDLQETVADGEKVQLIVTEDSITANSDICFSDWMIFRPEQISGQISYADFDIQGFQLTFDSEITGHTVSLGCEDEAGNTGVNIKGDTGSKVILNETTMFYHSSMQLDTLELTGSDCEIAIYNSSVNNTVETVVAPYGNGITVSNAQIMMRTFAEVENPSDATKPVDQYLWVEGASKVIIGKMYENCRLNIDYLDMETIENSTVLLTGKKVPQAVIISAAVNHQISNAGADRAFLFNSVGKYLLYAPYVKSESVSVVCSVYNDLDGENRGQYSYYGQIEGADGYYKIESVPTIEFSDAFFVTEGLITESLTYSNANANGDLKSVSWNIHEIGPNGYVDHPEWTKTFGWTTTELGFGIDGLNSNSMYFLNGYFTYENGNAMVVIPIFVSPAVTSASFSAKEITLVKPGYITDNIVTLNYEASATPDVVWTTSNPKVISIVGSGVSAKQKVNGYGSAVVKAYIGNRVLSCKISIAKYDTTINGWHQEANGDWYYYKDGLVDTSKNGILPKDGEYWYVVQGKADFTVTTVAQYEEKWMYVKDGKVDFSYTGLAKNYSGWWYIKKGIVDFEYFGVATNKSGTWYVKGGKVDFSIEGVAKCGSSWYIFEGGKVQQVTTVAKNPYGWWYFNKGKLDKSYNGVASNSRGTWYVANGKVDFSKSGVLKCGEKWYLFEGGAVQFVTTIVETDEAWYYINNGEVDFSYIGVVEKESGKWYYVQDGKVDFTYDGVASDNNGDIYYVEDGKVDFTKSGIIKRSNIWYYFKDGKVQAVDTIVKHTNGKWYAVWNGVIDMKYDGIASNGKNTYYIENGKVDFTKAGIHKRSGKYYYFKAGKVQFVDTIIKHTNGNWYAVWDGVIDFTFEGIASNSRGMYYCQKGKVNFSFTGTVEYEGKTYKVVNGKAKLVE